MGLLKKKRVLFIILFSFINLGFSYIGTADNDSEGQNIGFTVSSVQNGKQIDPNESYFYVQTTPGEEQELTVKIKSTQKEEVNVNVYVANAMTTEKGTVEYSEDLEQIDSTLKDPLTSIIAVNNPKITIGNFEEKEITFKLAPPKESYPGIKMGVLVFELDSEEKEKEKATVNSRFYYRVGIITSENGDDYLDGKSLNLLNAKANLRRGKKMILATLQNPEPKVLTNLELSAEIREKGKDRVIKREKVSNYVLAPNSQFDFEIDWGSDKIPAGTYVLSLVGSNGLNEFNFSKEFEITSVQAKEMDSEYALKIVTPLWIKIFVIIAFITILILSIIIYKRRKKFELEWKIRRVNQKKRKRKKEGR